MNSFVKIGISFCFCFAFLFSQAQNDTITIKGRVTDEDNPYVWMPCMVVNKATGKGVFGNNSGRFSIKIKRSDTLLINASGYIRKTVCYKDSLGKEFELNIGLSKQPIVLNPVDVKPERDLEKIEEDIKTLKKEETYTVTGINVAKSPITALYERFSKIGREKAAVAELEYEDKRKELLRELLSKYVRYDIIDLGQQDFDKFIDFLNLPDEFIQQSTQYDLIMAIKYRYEIWESWQK